MKFNKVFPWLDNNGKKLSEELLIKSIESWGPETWERYLKTLEYNRKESQITNEQFFNERAERIQISQLFNQAEDSQNLDKLKEALDLSIQQLSPKHRDVINGVYYQNLTTRELGSRMKVSSAAISKMRKRAIQKLEKSIVQSYILLSSNIKNILSNVLLEEVDLLMDIKNFSMVKT